MPLNNHEPTLPEKIFWPMFFEKTKKNFHRFIKIKFNVPMGVRTSCTRSQRIEHAGDRGL